MNRYIKVHDKPDNPPFLLCLMLLGLETYKVMYKIWEARGFLPVKVQSMSPNTILIYFTDKNSYIKAF